MCVKVEGNHLLQFLPSFAIYYASLFYLFICCWYTIGIRSNPVLGGWVNNRDPGLEVLTTSWKLQGSVISSLSLSQNNFGKQRQRLYCFICIEKRSKQVLSKYFLMKNTTVCPGLTSLCSFLHFSVVTMSWLSRVGMVSDLMTLGGGGGALNKPSSLWELLSLLLLDNMA